MKRDFLKGLGLEGEAIDKIMEQYGTSITTLKTNLETSQEENVSLKAELVKRDDSIKDLTAKVSEYDTLKTNYDKLVANHEIDVNSLKEQLLQKEYDHNAEKVFANLNFSSTSAKENTLNKFKNKIKEKAITYNDESKTFDGFDDFINEIKTSDPTAFVDPKKPVFATRTDGSGNSGITKEEFNRMSYSKRVEFKKNNQEEYEQLMSE